ncbi:MAG: RuvA [uncultured Thermomicrobiales bacterium]|uniref:Holliday junction branch migration complex subunit RuvA n=1 Tax=uncultured Thermomicrobiales bacterium TaxID=1645740 RepID=A0A6J4UID6_9BACT|nr:MAG: RuvA [uncultured Thermomicrobiales bacterium]
MIAGLRGRVFAKTTDSLFIDVNGVIYQVGTSANTLGDSGDQGAEVMVVTRLIVREDQMALYGFTTEDELRLFDTLVSVTGVGPRLACAVLSRFPIDQLHNAIASENASLLATVPGIGQKTAARLILEMRGKLPALQGLPSRTGAMAVPGRRADEVVEALQALGYSPAEIATSVSNISPEIEGTEARLLAALRSLGNR